MALDRGELFTELELVPDLFLDLVLLDGGEEHQGRDDHEDGGDDEGHLDGPDIALGNRSVDIAAEHEENAEDRGKGAAEITHDVDDAVGSGTQRLGRDVRHQGDGGVAVHHHENQDDGHGDDHADHIVMMEEKGDEGESDGRDEGADQNIGHALADGGVGFVGQVAEDRQQDQRGQVVAGHDDADDPLDIQNPGRVACLQLGRGHLIDVPGENIGQEGGTPGVIDLPEKQNAEEGKADHRRAAHIQLQRSEGRFFHVSILNLSLLISAGSRRIRASARPTWCGGSGQRCRDPPAGSGLRCGP